MKRAQITYTIKVEDIGKEIKRLINEVKFDLNSKIEEIKSQISKETSASLLTSLDMVDKLRLKMAESDQRLSECCNLIDNWEKSINTNSLKRMQEKLDQMTDEEMNIAKEHYEHQNDDEL